ncbi:MAG: vanadium-dependent haloperoxidase [Acidobacteriota bacterium]|nr:vanadium-dependent haloperoxidase [Acidobacteriota bacterium]
MGRTTIGSDSSTTAAPALSNRRSFLRHAGGAVAAAGLIGLPQLAGKARAQAAVENPSGGSGRADRAFRIRQQAALYQKNLPAARQQINGDEELYASRIACYSKALPHNALGEVDPVAYKALALALKSGNPVDFENIPPSGALKQGNPQASFAFELEGTDSHNFGMASPPAFNSAEMASEMVELYWQALTRDIPFADYKTHSLTNAASAELTKLPAFGGPKLKGQITTDQLFRGTTAGDLRGPYVSQFLWKNVPYGATTLVQRINTAAPHIDFMTSFEIWLDVQNGNEQWRNQIDASPRYIRSGRDLGEYVHQDFTYQAFLNAALILMGMGAPRDPANPYKNSRTQSGFGTFGAPHILDAVARVANCGLKAAWYQKWVQHRRLRPEEFGGRVAVHWNGKASYPIHASVLKSAALEQVFRKHGSYLLPQAYPEGCPAHPAYPAGHAVIAGACTTVLKAFFDESYVIRNPVTARADGFALLPYKGTQLTVGGELDKLASNVAIGRNLAGVHWRTDSIEGLKLGEAVALSVMMDMKDCFNERFGGFSLTKFDGKTVTI